jgi:hypothetical protein
MNRIKFNGDVMSLVYAMTSDCLIFFEFEKGSSCLMYINGMMKEDGTGTTWIVTGYDAPRRKFVKLFVRTGALYTAKPC